VLSSPTTAVIGASDLARTVEFLALFDLAPTAQDVLPAGAAEALYGVERELAEMLLTADGSLAGSVRVLGPVAPVAGLEGDHYATGAHAFDLYTCDMAASLHRVNAAGYEHGPVGHVELGPLVMDQVLITGPDGLVVVLIESQRRRPSLLDSDTVRLHSEGHSFIWAVDSMDEALPFWAAAPGLSVPFDAPVVHPEVNRFMGLPDADAKLRMAMVCDDAVSPMRFELLEFVGRSGAVRQSWPLHAGLHAPSFGVDDLDGAVAVLAPDASFGEVVEVESKVHGSARGCTALAPGGVRFELWESA
jgi:hypothetical protein